MSDRAPPHSRDEDSIGFPPFSAGHVKAKGKLCAENESFHDSGSELLPSPYESAARAAERPASTSMSVFLSHLHIDTLTGDIDASGIVSTECYADWLRVHSRKYKSGTKMAEEKAFQRAITSHITGSDRRRSFSPEQEAAVLLELRRKRPWPAFGGELTMGARGFNAYGYHEKLQFAERMRKAGKWKSDSCAEEQANQTQNHAEELLTRTKLKEPLVPGDSMFTWLSSLDWQEDAHMGRAIDSGSAEELSKLL